MSLLAVGSGLCPRGCGLCCFLFSLAWVQDSTQATKTKRRESNCEIKAWFLHGLPSTWVTGRSSSPLLTAGEPLSTCFLAFQILLLKEMCVKGRLSTFILSTELSWESELLSLAALQRLNGLAQIQPVCSWVSCSKAQAVLPTHLQNPSVTQGVWITGRDCNACVLQRMVNIRDSDLQIHKY